MLRVLKRSLAGFASAILAGGMTVGLSVVVVVCYPVAVPASAYSLFQKRPT